jgi:hypothetical protein
MDDNGFLALVNRYLEGECSEEDKALLRDTLEKDAGRKAIFLKHYRLQCALQAAAAKRKAVRARASRRRWAGLAVATSMAAVAAFMVAADTWPDKHKAVSGATFLTQEGWAPTASLGDAMVPFFQPYGFSAESVGITPSNRASLNTQPEFGNPAPAQFGVLLPQDAARTMAPVPQPVSQPTRIAAPLPPTASPTETWRITP